MTAPGGGDSRNANVVLTADTSQYQQQMAASTQSTNHLSNAIQALTSHLDGLTKRAGKRLVQFSASDFAALGGATTTAATFEKQLGTLRSTALLTNQSFKEMKGGIESTFTSMPVSRTQVIQLTEAITNLGITGVRQITSLSQIFTKLGAATGENSIGLAQGLVQLSRLMGTTNAQQIGNFANALLTVSKNAGVSATGVLNFAQAIAPMARQAGIGEAAVLGISTAFSKAGADGYVAANTFNSMVSDITNLIQVGSPQLQKYARLVGTTATEFAKMDKANALTQIFEAINRQGPRAIQTLNQLGFEGIRAQAAISAVVQSGGLRQAISQATGSANDQGNLNRGARTAMQGLVDELIKVRNNFVQLGTEIGTTFLTPLTKVISVFNTMFETLNKIIKPFAPIIAAVGALAGAFTGLAGAALLTFAAISKISLAAALIRPMLAFRGGMEIGRNPAATNAYAERNAAGTLGIFSRSAFTAGAGLGRTMGPPGEGGGIGGLAAFGLRTPFMVTRGLANAQTEFLRETATTPPIGGAGTFLSTSRARRTFAQGSGAAEESAGAAAAAKSTTVLSRAQEAATKVVRNNAEAAAAAGTASRLVANESRVTALSIANLGRQSLATGASMVGRGLLAGGGMLARGAGAALSSPIGLLALTAFAPQIYSGVKSLFGIHPGQYESAGSGNNISRYDERLGQTSSNLAQFSTAVSDATNRLKNLAGQPVSAVKRITPSDVSAAGGNYKVADQTFGVFKGGGASGVAGGVAYIQGLAAQHGGLDAQYFQTIKQDLIATVGPQRAQQIIDAYISTSSAGGGSPQINYGQLGKYAGTLNPKNFQSLSSQVFSSISSQGQLATGRESSQATLNAILNFAGGAVGSGRSTQQTQLGNELNKFFRTDYFKNYSFSSTNPTQARNQLLRDMLIASATNSNLRSTLQSAGVNVNQLYKQFQGAGILNSANVGPAVQAQLGTGTTFGSPLAVGAPENTALQRTALGRFVIGTTGIQNVIGTGPSVGNPAAQAKAQENLVNTAIRMNGGLDQAATALRHLADTASQQADPALQALADAAASQARQQYESTQLPTQTRGQQTQYYIGRVAETRKQYQATGTDQAKQEYQQALSQLQQQQEANRQFVLQMYQTVRNYNIQTERSYQDYYKSTYRSQRDFNIQMLQSEQDFQKQRYRMIRDFNIQLREQAVQAAQSIYNPFQRVFDQQTADAGTVLQNLQDQNGRIQQQYAQLQQLRRMGVSQQTIDVLNLADPTNAQQLNNLIQGITNNPTMVRAINAAVNQRQKATTQLTQSDFNVTFRNTVDQFHRTFNDMTTDFNTQRERAREAEQRSLNDMAFDFNQMMDRQAEDMKTAMTEISGTMEDLMKKTFRELGKSISQYAPEYANTIQQALDSINLPGAGGSGGSEGGNLGPRGSSSNPITTPNTLGVNPSGQIGTYDKSGKFHPYKGYVSPSQAQAYEKIHIAPSNANTPAGAQSFARAMLSSYGWSQGQMQPLIYLWDRESGWRWNAENHTSGAYGIPQSLPANKMASAGSDWRTNGATQIKWGLAYIKGRYGSPAGAWAHEQSHNWYDQGGVLKPGITKAINATGGPEFILTPAQLKAFNTAGLGKQTTNIHKTFIDNSMTFKDITVVAQDPNAMAKALQAKARLAKLVSPPRTSLHLG